MTRRTDTPAVSPLPDSGSGSGPGRAVRTGSAEAGAVQPAREGFDRSLAVAFGWTLDELAVSAVLLLGCVILWLGLGVVSVSLNWGFTFEGAIAGIQSQLAVTGPAAVLMAAATTANVLAGAVVLRMTGGAPYRNLTELVLAGFTTAVFLDTAVVFLLGSFGLVGWPELVALHALVFGSYVPMRARLPLLAAPTRVHFRRPLAWWPLVVAIWAGPLIVQLGAPAVPFMDVLPNHVAPVEHIRVFGSFATLTTSPSPIYGPSRLMLGYVATLGQLTTISNLDAVLSEAAFAFPLAVLVALSMRRLAGALFGGSAGFWVLLTFPLTFTFMRIPDARGTVVVFPLIAYGLSVIAGELRSAVRSPATGRPDLALTFALGGAVLVHPLVGVVGCAAAIGALILYPRHLGPRLIPALGGAAFVALPQALTMGAIAAPSWIGFLMLAVGVAVAFGLARLISAVESGRAAGTTAVLRRLASVWSAALSDGPSGLYLPFVRAWLVVVGIFILAYEAQAHVGAPDDPGSQIDVFARLTALCLIGAGLASLRPSRGWILLGCGLGAGLGALAASGFVGRADLTQQAIHYEVPKSVEYWTPVMLAVGAAGAIAGVMRLRGLGMLRFAFVLAFLAVSVYPIYGPITVGPLTLDSTVFNSPPVSNVQIGEHRGAESVGLALREAELGYWNFSGYPDARTIIDAPRQEVVDEIRSLEDAGKIGPSTQILHIASDFQQWTSVPIGVFTGAIETSISPRPEVSIHTEGGRLLGFDQLDAQLAARPGFVVVEPSNLAGDVLDSSLSKIADAGYREIWSNSQATIYSLG
jgi:hypothetical protein